MIVGSVTEPRYTEASASYTLDVYQGADTLTETYIALETGSSAEVTLDVPEDALYEIWFEYKNTAATTLPTEIELRVDGAIPFNELRRLKFESRWIDDGSPRLDRYGNQIAPALSAPDVSLRKGLSDSSGRTADPFLFELTRGKRAITITCADGAIAITNVALRKPEPDPRPVTAGTAGGGLITIEAENPAWRNASDLRGAAAFMPELSPYDARKKTLNHLDGESFDRAGDTVAYTLTVEEAGFYRVGFHARQNAKRGFPVFIDIRVDGVVPAEGMRRVPFAYSSGFITTTAPGSVYLDEGTHTLELTINNETLTPVIEGIERLLSEINGLSLEVTRLTGGVATDRYRDYSLTTYIPNLKEILLNWADRCEGMAASMLPYATDGSVAHFSNLQIAADQFRRLAEKPEDLPRRLAELNTGANSAARMLAQQLTDMADCGLSIDRIYIYQDDADLPRNPVIVEKAVEVVKRFFLSFYRQDYDASSADDGNLRVWIARPRQYAELLQDMADSSFTRLTGVTADISIMPDAQKLVLANAPDAALSTQYVIPSYLNIRGALLDLAAFDDFADVASRFSTGLSRVAGRRRDTGLQHFPVRGV
jgi:hypothetical protein